MAEIIIQCVDPNTGKVLGSAIHHVGMSRELTDAEKARHTTIEKARLVFPDWTWGYDGKAYTAYIACYSGATLAILHESLDVVVQEVDNMDSLKDDV